MQYVVAAVASASIYALIALGITLTYGVARIMNVAHALMFVLAAFLTSELVDAGWPYVLAAVGSVLAVSIVGAAVYLLLLDRLRDRPYASLVVGLGLVVAGEAIFRYIWKLDVRQVPGLLSEVRSIGPVSFTVGSVVTVGVAVVVLLVMAVVFRRTEMGRAMRAVAENPATAALLGVRARRVSFVVFVVGTAMAGVAGALVGTFIPFSSASADVFVLKTFAIAIVGGLGSPVGAVVAAMIFAGVEVVPVALGHANLSTMLVFVVMVAVLIVRPDGLFGRRGQHGSEHGALPARRRPSPDRGGTLRELGGVLGCVLVLLVVPLAVGDPTFQGLATYMICLTLAAFAVWIPLQFLGVASIAHAALMGVAAYAAALAAAGWGVGFWTQLLLACLLSGVAALLVASVAMRLTTLPAVAIVTLALGGLLVSVILNLPTYTGGTNGLVLSAPLELFGQRFGVADADVPLYLVGLAVLGAMMVGSWLAWRSRWGTTLLAIKDNADLAESLGVHSYLQRVAVLGASGVLAGVSGILYAYYSRFLEPATFDANLSIVLLLAVLLGGAASLYGPLLGVAIYVFFPVVSPLDGEADLALYGVLLIVVATFAPHGLASLVHRRHPRQAPGPRVAAPAPPTAEEMVRP